MSAPALLCLNVRHEHVHGVRGPEVGEALDGVAREMARFRSNGWPVLHAHLVRPQSESHPRGALPGLEPRADEPVFALTSACALEEDEIRRAARAAGGLHVVGGAYSRTGLATALAADELGIRMIVIAEACFSPAEDKTERGLLTDISGDAARAENNRAAYEGTNVICLESWRL